MEYLNKFKSTVSSVAAQVTQALPGNPILREYEVHVQIATAGPGLAWKIFSGTKHTTKQPVAVWLFEKKTLDKWPKMDKEAFEELLKRGVSQLTKLRHPRLLIIERVLEESRDNFAFCTEPVFTSLANAFGDTENLGEHSPSLEDFQFENIEIEHGLFQLSEALNFLHNDAKILHKNICPNSIIVNAKGAWKLAGFEFCTTGVSDGQGRLLCEPFDWNRSLGSAFLPNLDFASPEIVNGQKCDHTSDIFSFGLVAASVYNKNKPVMKTKGSIDNYKVEIDKLSGNCYWLSNVPDLYKDDLKGYLNINCQLRPDTFQLTRSRLFDHTGLRALNYLESLMQMDNAQKMTFFKGLPNVLTNFPKRILVQKVLPCLSEQFCTSELVPFILPSVFFISQQVADKEFADTILPSLIPVFQMQRPYQIILLLLQQMPLLLQKTPEIEVKRHVLPMIYNSLSNDNPRIQELCLSIVPTIGKLVDRDAMRANLLPKLLKLVLEANVLSIRVLTLICLSKLLPTLEPWMVSDQILPALPKINSKEPGILMAVLGIYKLAFESEKFGINKELCARSALPFLVSTMVENTLNLNQFEQFVSLIKLMMTKVEGEQRTKLQQLSSGQEEQRKIGDFNDIFNKDNLNKISNMDDLGLDNGSSQENVNISMGSTFKTSTRNSSTLDMNVFNDNSCATAVQPKSCSEALNYPLPSLDDFDPFKSTDTSSFNSLMGLPSYSKSPLKGSTVPPPPTATNPVQRSTNLFNVDFVSSTVSSSSKPDPFENLLSSRLSGPSVPNQSAAGSNNVIKANSPACNWNQNTPDNFPGMAPLHSIQKTQTENLLDFLN